MIHRRLQIFVVAILAVTFVVDEDCFGALASQIGGGRRRFTARLASNAALRKQQLIIDPEGILGGSASVQYDTRMVRLVDVIAPGEFEVTGGFVGVIPSAGGLGVSLESLDAFLASVNSNSPGGREGIPPPDPSLRLDSEIGYVQVFFGLRNGESALRAAGATNSVIPNLPGYATVDEDGETGVVDTHALVFEYLPRVDPLDRAAYNIFATAPRSQTVPDSIISADDPDSPIPYFEIGGATVLGPLEFEEFRPPPAVPLPPAAIPGLICLGGLAIGLARRQLGKANQPT